MVCKIIFLALFVACTQAIHYDGHEATSHIVFNDNHNTVHHIQSAYAAPAHGYAAPAIHYSHAAPAAHYNAPATQYATPITQHAAPAYKVAAPIVKVAAPVLVKSGAPAHGHASSYSSLSFGQDSHYGAPTQYTAPAHYAAPAPVAKYAVVAPSFHGSSYSTQAAPAIHAAPAVTKFVAPVAKVIAAPAYHHAPSYNHEEEYGPAKYDFAYGVEDHQSGDIHSHKESREGDVIHGEYSLHEADGTIRTVKYNVDKHSGFNAVVERSGHAGHAQPAKVLKAVAAPAQYYHH